MNFETKCDCGCGTRFRIVDFADKRLEISTLTHGERRAKYGVVLDRKQLVALRNYVDKHLKATA